MAYTLTLTKKPLSRKADRRLKKSLSIAMLLIVLAVNAFFIAAGLRDEPALFGTLMLAINVLAIGVIFVIFAVGELLHPEEVPIVELITSILIAVVGTCVACVWLVSLVFVFSSNGFMPGSKTYAALACYSSVVIMALFVYYVYIHQHA